MRPFLVVMAGGTASGKTTLARGLADLDDVLLIAHDRYYRDVVDASTANFDHPDALDTPLLVEHVDRLLAGDAVELPVYDFPRHARSSLTERVEPHRVVVVEGILALASPELVARADLRVFVHADADLRLARRVVRDIAERGWSVTEVIERYLTTVRPMHQRYVEPTRAHADLVLNGEAQLDDVLADLHRVIRERLTR